MSRTHSLLLLLIGLAAGFVTGIFGGGGGMILVPLLTLIPEMQENNIFPTSISIILPICIVSILFASATELTCLQVAPYLLGSFLGGIAAGIWGPRIPVQWLHRILGILILWGGLRYLWPITF